MSLPFRMLHRNTMLGHGDQHAALYRLETVSFPFLAQADKDSVLAQLATFAYQIGCHFSLYRVCRAYPARAYVDQAMPMLDSRFANPETWRAFLSGHQEHLAGLSSFVPETYLALELRGKRAISREQVRDTLTRARRRHVILRRDLKVLDAAEDRIFRLAAGLLPVRRATTLEIQWLLKRPASRGLTEPYLDENYRPTAIKVTADDGREAYRPHRADLERLVLPKPVPTLTGVRVPSDDGETHQAMLTLGHLPTLANTEGPGNAAFLYTPLEQVPFPVDVVIHARRIPNPEALKKVRRKVIDADTELAEQDEAGASLSDLPAENTRLARSLYDYLQDPSAPPLLDVTVGLAVSGGADPELLGERVDTLRQHFGTIALHKPLGSQLPLYADHFPRPDFGRFRHYAAAMTVEQIASLIPHGVHHTGPSHGVYFARAVTGSQRPVKVDLTEATRRKRSPSWLLTGGLGAGKTQTLELLELQAALRGSTVVDVDPKNDHRLERLPELDGRVTIIEMDGSVEHEGRLDPLTIGTAENREDLALSYYLELVPQAPLGWETHYTKAIRAALATDDPCGQRVLDYLERAPEADAREAGEALAVRGDTGLGRMAFADGRKVAELGNFATMPVTTIRPGILELPTPDTPRASYTRIERVSVATFALLTNFAMSLLGTDRTAHKVLGVDEAWFLLATPAGRRFVSRVNFFGRTNFISLLLSAQTLGGEIAGDIEDLIGTRIVLGQESETQARLNLQVLGLDATDRALVARLLRYEKGRGLMKDLDARVAEIQIDPVYPHILDLLDVNRDPARERAHAA